MRRIFLFGLQANVSQSSLNMESAPNPFVERQALCFEKADLYRLARSLVDGQC